MAGPSQLAQGEGFEIFVEEDITTPTIDSAGAGSARRATTRRAAQKYSGANKRALGTMSRKALDANGEDSSPPPSPDENQSNALHDGDETGAASSPDGQVTGNCSHTPTDEEQSSSGASEIPPQPTRRRSLRVQAPSIPQLAQESSVRPRSSGSIITTGSRITRSSSRVSRAAQKNAGSETPATPRTLRRSSRLEVKDPQPVPQTVLGKRTREKGQKPSQTTARRASLRPKNAVPETKKQEPKPTPRKAEPKQKEKVPQASPEPEKEPHAEAVVEISSKKIWLDYGLFAGQRAYSKNELSNMLKRLKSKRSSMKEEEAKDEDEEEGGSTFLPLPMHGGAKLIETGRDFKLPFDIFSPLPPGQPKPEEWRTINKIESGCGQSCQNRTTLYECNDNNCRLGPEHCRNRSFDELRRRTKGGNKYDIGVDVFKTEDRGYGVRSNRTFEPGQIIVEYTGEVITQDECEKRMRSVYKKNQCYYLMHLDRNMVIDATRGSIARFVNHSCEPNCKMEKWTVANKPRMALFAGSNGIMTGEELTYDYNFNPYSRKNAQICRCGAPTCRGVLGPRPPRDNRKSQEDDEKQTEKVKGRPGRPAKTGSKTRRESVGTATSKQIGHTEIENFGRDVTAYCNFTNKDKFFKEYNCDKEICFEENCKHNEQNAVNGASIGHTHEAISEEVKETKRNARSTGLDAPNSDVSWKSGIEGPSDKRNYGHMTVYHNWGYLNILEYNLPFTLRFAVPKNQLRT
ncbi:fatty-acyl coenzyme A oxidase [Ascosphaera pollenicola]|nr:fatty-acyl coenzyme A oxidase [Ascosphaera pollenicola]